MTQPQPGGWPDERELPRLLADAEEIDADPGTERAIDEALDDYAAGRFIRCHGEDEFDALLASLAAHPHPRAG
ncbi:MULTISPECIES: hypothetical protein [Protofrankia]|uniref:Uncharacterized protein n=1 Tax=Protofrankia coriariae TaxID=1562887 RepID=A0ABR5F5Q2_9ACTN|nr:MULTISPECIES: hypothetical protein [Protofrankia]KLL12062.1 hypothetical protein FrCorBMG51_07340 [Protofrankia coriariae]ONH35352.1 hypothetical protein BL254_11815 [Protofrankia sp. BMG5.30]